MTPPSIKSLPKITVHGRFQPPLHINHWAYIKEAFDRAEFVQILITNPNLNEAFDASASWRNDPANNPFSYNERIQMFRDFFNQMNINQESYNFQPFNIKDDASFKELDPDTPNLINVYSEWSAKKVYSFKSHGLPIIQLDQPKRLPVSGTKIREIINSSTSFDTLPNQLIKAGFMAQAIPGLIRVLRTRK